MDIQALIFDLKEVSLWNNTMYDYVLAFLVFLAAIIVLKLFQAVILARLRKFAQKTKTDLDDIMIEVFSGVRPPFYFFVALFVGIKMLTFPELVSKIITILFLIVVVFEVVTALSKLIDFFFTKYMKAGAKGKDKKMSETMGRALTMLVKAVLWVVAIILILGNLGVNVTSLIASLGIGGIAIALALQNVLSDMFSSFSIYLDKPFQIGDFITIGQDSGTVEKIGLKTTRVRTLQGEELVISNQELTTARVGNFKKMDERRVVANLGVIYGTTSTRLKMIPKLCKDIIKNQKNANFGRCFFKTFGDFSLNFELVYNVKSQEYDEYARVTEKINLEIYRAFEKEMIEFAYPTQTVFVNKEELE